MTWDIAFWSFIGGHIEKGGYLRGPLVDLFIFLSIYWLLPSDFFILKTSIINKNNKYGVCKAGDAAIWYIVGCHIGKWRPKYFSLFADVYLIFYSYCLGPRLQISCQSFCTYTFLRECRLWTELQLSCCSSDLSCVNLISVIVVHCQTLRAHMVHPATASVAQEDQSVTINKMTRSGEP